MKILVTGMNKNQVTENFYLNNRKLMSKIKISNDLESLKKDCLNLSKRLFK